MLLPPRRTLGNILRDGRAEVRCHGTGRSRQIVFAFPPSVHLKQILLDQPWEQKIIVMRSVGRPRRRETNSSRDVRLSRFLGKRYHVMRSQVDAFWAPQNASRYLFSAHNQSNFQNAHSGVLRNQLWIPLPRFFTNPFGLPAPASEFTDPVP